MTQLTTSQLQALRTAIDANPTWAAYPNNSDGHYTLAAELNNLATPGFSVWRTDAPVSSIINAVSWASYTPNDKIGAADTDPTLSRKIGWLLEIQVKQMNLQLFLQGQQTFNAAPPNMRGGLRDAVIQVPSGASGAATSPGGASGSTALAACVRQATWAEQILATPASGSDSTGATTARVMGFEGSLQPIDVQAARA